MSDMRIWMVAVSSLARRRVGDVGPRMRRVDLVTALGGWNANVAVRDRSQMVVEIIVVLLLFSVWPEGVW